jgi:hypothetical protein
MMCQALEHEDSRLGATTAIRGLIEAILLEPDGDQLKITLKGDLAGMLSAATDSKRSPDSATSWSKFRWLRGLATNIICSFGDLRLEAAHGLDLLEAELNWKYRWQLTC